MRHRNHTPLLNKKTRTDFFDMIYSMGVLLGFIFTLVVIFVIPILVYGLFNAFFGLKEPKKKLGFFIGVLLQKIGTAFGFVLLFHLGREYFLDNWLLYGLVWFVMFALTEIGQTFMPNYSKKEAIAGAIAEAIYFPLSAYILLLLTR